MTKEKREYWITYMQKAGWSLATHSTILSRKLDGHKFIGPLHFVKPLRIIQKEQRHEAMKKVYEQNYGKGEPNEKSNIN